MNATTLHCEWPTGLSDLTGCRQPKPRTSGRTMVIDKGLGIGAYEDLLLTAGEHIDMMKIGFGTAPLYPVPLLHRKIELAKQHNIVIYPGGTFLELAVTQNMIGEFFDAITQFGFTGVEVSDGTIPLNRSLRNELIWRALDEGLQVYTEYGKKCWGSTIEINELIQTVMEDLEAGARSVTIEARESGTGVGLFDGNGKCRDEDLELVLRYIPDLSSLIWEAPLKDQQVRLLQELGPEVHLGNIPPQEVIALESMRRGLRSDTLFMMRSLKETVSPTQKVGF